MPIFTLILFWIAIVLLLVVATFCNTVCTFVADNSREVKLNIVVVLLELFFITTLILMYIQILIK